MDETTWKILQFSIWGFGIGVTCLLAVAAFLRSSMDKSIEAFENRMNKKFDVSESSTSKKFEVLESSTSKKFEMLENAMSKKFEEQDKKIDSVNTALSQKIDKLDEKLTDVDRRLCRLEGAFASKDCCMIKDDRHLRKAQED
jgi:biopolymer transport protein ExbB/TolQ